MADSNQLFTKSFKVYADFSKITGIQNGGKVRVAGMDAGTVTRIEVPSRPDGKFRIHFRIVEKLHPIVRQDSVATIQTDGLLGNKYLQIDAGSGDSPLARNNSMIQSKEPFEWGDLMEEITGVVKQVNGIMAGVKEQLVSTLSQIEGTAKSANLLIRERHPAGEEHPGIRGQNQREPRARSSTEFSKARARWARCSRTKRCTPA